MRSRFCGGFAALAFVFLTACSSSVPVTATPGPDHRVVVNHDQSLDTKIVAGHYDWVDDNIRNSVFTPNEKTGTQTETMVLFSVDQGVSSETMVAEMVKPRSGAPKGYRPATLDELLAFGRDIGEFKPSFPIIALGSAAQVHGPRRVPGLWGAYGHWRLGLPWWDYDWDSGCRFLAVRN